jgi:hypothetical protein
MPPACLAAPRPEERYGVVVLLHQALQEADRNVDLQPRQAGQGNYFRSPAVQHATAAAGWRTQMMCALAKTGEAVSYSV